LRRIISTEKVHLPNGTVGERRVSTFGAVLQYAAVYIDDRPMAFAYVQRVKYAKRRRGQCGYAATKYGIECILGLV